MKTLTQIADALEARRAELKSALESVKGEDGQVDVEAAQSRMSEFDQIKADIAALETELKSAQALADLERDNETAIKDMARVQRTVALPAGPQAKTLGELAIEAKALDGREVHLDIDVKALFSSTSLVPQVTRSGQISEVALYPTTISDAIPSIPTGQTSYRFQQETWVNAAGEIAEGAAYPEATLSYADVDVPVRKVSVILPVTDEELEDVEGVQALINSRLVRMLQQRVNTQLVNGNGVAPNIRGILAQAGINAVPKGVGETNADAILRGLQTTRSVGAANPSFVVVNPMDWALLITEKTVGSGEYINARSVTTTPDTIWGIPVIQSPELAAGSVLIVDTVYTYAVLRRGVDLQIGFDGTDFSHGRKSVRADIRMALACIRPQSVTQVTGIA